VETLLKIIVSTSRFYTTNFLVCCWKKLSICMQWTYIFTIDACFLYWLCGA